MRAILINVVALPVFLNLALPVYTMTERLLAWSIFAASVIPFISAITQRRRTLPLLPLIAAQYLVFYSFSVFFEDSAKTLGGWIVPSRSAIDVTLVCVLMSIIAIQIGYSVAGGILRPRFKLFQFVPSDQKLFWYASVTLVGAAIISYSEGTLLGWEPGGLFHPLTLILSVDVGIAILACLYYQGKLSLWKKVAAVGLLCMSVAMGLAGGMFQNIVEPIGVWAVCRWIVKGRAPIGVLVFVTIAFFAVQPIKGSYRSIALLGGRNFTTVQKISFFSSLIQKEWLGSAAGGADMASIASSSRISARNRLSMLLTTAHYVDWTPRPLDYRNGSTLGYVLYGWIPRAVWPDKPIAQEANKVLPVDYRIQSASNQNTTMFGVGHIAEVYVNFGMLGIIPVFFVFGILYRVPQLLLDRRRTVATVAIFIATAISMAGIGSTVSDSFAGFLQQLFLQGLMLRVFTAQRTPRHSRLQPTPARMAMWANRRRHTLPANVSNQT